VRRITEVSRIARLKRDAHKGDRGRVLIVAGSQRMSGAARLAGWGALRGGAGLVTIATPDTVQPIVAADLVCALTLPLPSKKGAFSASGATLAREVAAEMDAVAVGPGITTEVLPFLRRFLRGLTAPLVLDADALNLIALDASVLEDVETPRILTPHPGEASRLLGRKVGSDREARVKAAAQLADRFGAVVVLKGAGTVVSDGERYYVERAGNPGMATGGTGDVLTGVTVARLALGVEPITAAVQAVHVHERAGDLAAAAIGENAMIATDLIANLPAAMNELTEPAPKSKRSKSSGRRT
jgi:NAD(P)H-hydrate epimerase